MTRQVEVDKDFHEALVAAAQIQYGMDAKMDEEQVRRQLRRCGLLH